ncbi:cytochrome P450 [Mycolicibacter sinensis]|uniref:Cytochrome n=1 Tax=Mycolicibacter sinensis (strain JDM601) TaxID=875328 RepID=A0A1A3TU91_MYCSD|nr:cytochrome P450 [Mycolicibacter sinensis]OBK86204.1 cytochrome [Mycolicibacter sinensis]
MTTTTTREHDTIDLSAKAFWTTTATDREHAYAELRAKRPISWQRPVEDAWYPEPDDPGYWAILRRDDIIDVSRRNDVFVSRYGVNFETLPPHMVRASQSILGMDPPDHTQIRRLVSAAFTPRQVRRIQEQIEANAREIVDGIVGKGEVEFVSECAALLPMITVCDMIGVPEADRLPVARAAEVITGWNDPDTRDGRPLLEALPEAGRYLTKIGRTLAAQRREDPRDDLMTALVQAEVNGERLPDSEISSFFTLLCIAGTDTTRQTTSHVVKALTDFPEQRAWLLEDFDGRIGTAIEEFIRWASPVMTFRRTAVTDTVVGGQEIKAGEKVVMFYPSGNWDETAFDHPERFDLSRSPNHHLGFGGGGAHYCLGAQVAKAQLRALFRALLHHAPDFEAGQPEYLAGNLIHGIKRMPVKFTAKR